MSYKTILVHVDDSSHAATRIEVAAAIAMAQNAHLIGAAVTGVSRFIEEAVAANPYSPAITPYLDTLRQRASVSLDKFEEQVHRIGVRSFERRLSDDEGSGGIGLQARYSDLVVVGQSDPAEPAHAVDVDFPEYVALTSGAPVLIIPFAREFPRVGLHAVVAWNGSREARRAVQDAIPLLQAAQTVDVAVLNPVERHDEHGAEPGADMARYLHRHGIKVELKVETVKHGELGEALLSMVAAASADLLVMGCYGHTRFREMLLGGVTRHVLASMTVPVFMAH